MKVKDAPKASKKRVNIPVKIPHYLMGHKNFDGAVMSEFKRHLNNGIVDSWEHYGVVGKKAVNSSDCPVFIHEVLFLLPFVQGYLISTIKKVGDDPNIVLNNLLKGTAKASMTKLIKEMSLKHYKLWDKKKGFVLEYI